MSALRVAVVGAGPAGLYAVAALAAADIPVEVDVLDRLPAPYGLVRYGVAPDHAKVKSVVRVLGKPFAQGSVRFLGNVRVGEGGVPLDVLREHYHAVVHASGTSVDRTLGIDGETLAGCHGSRAVVGWYSGHPDFAGLEPDLDIPAAVVIGAGNVALDVARVLVRRAADMAGTDVPDPVLGALRRSSIRHVHIMIRRGPEHVRFTPAELLQLDRLDGVEVVVHDDGSLAAGAPETADKRLGQVLGALADWAARPAPAPYPAPGVRRLHLHFQRTPVRLAGENGRVSGIVVERTGTGERQTIDAGLVVRAIGYRGEVIAGLPFDERSGTVPNDAGRVTGPYGVVPGAYVTGWLKRGPSGVIGSNKADAQETVAALLADAATLPAPACPGPVLDRLVEHGADPVAWADWERLDAEEMRLGAARGGTERVKLARLADMLGIAWSDLHVMVK